MYMNFFSCEITVGRKVTPYHASEVYGKRGYIKIGSYL